MAEKSTMMLYPFWDVCKTAELYINKGATIHQQWNCAHCGVKQTMAEANKMFMQGKCEECGELTDILKDGCNQLCHFNLSEPHPARRPS
jgi:PHP family Zn ribbon phosphoesterase